MNPIPALIPNIRIIANSNSGAGVICPGGSGTCNTGLPKIAAGSAEVHQLLAIVFGVAAVISVLMIVVGGFMYITSGGNSDKATKARETIIYAVAGLVVSLSAEAIVAFVLGKL